MPATPTHFPPRSAFPAGFRFGAATSAFQIEGAVATDGRGPSWWDVFAQTPGCILDGSNADLACDHYHRWREDLDLARTLGHGAYRFSIAWPRVLPQGRGLVNRAGLDFYDRLVDGLLARGLEPYATLYHWDLPQALALQGGWQVRSTAQAFADYAAEVARRLADRVPHWATLNEPRCAAFVGHLEGRHPPGQQDLSAALRTAHHLLLAHGLAMQALRAEGARGLGIVLDLKPHLPANPTDARDCEAARHGDGVFNRWFLDPLFRGSYPSDITEGWGQAMPEVADGDMDLIATPMDELGINYYTRARVVHDAGLPFPHLREQPEPGLHRSTMGWEDWPQGLLQTLTRVQRDYAPVSVYVAENGCAEPDAVDAQGGVPDPDRLRYLAGHLGACAQALEAGVPLSAYLAWSLLDNFEWGCGYTQRFGLVHVDFTTQRRTPKASALAWRDWLCMQPDLQTR
jgi:beta-glucosidase